MPFRHTGTRKARINRAWSGLLVAALAGLLLWAIWPVDRSRGLAPEAIAAASGQALLQEGEYRFEVSLSGNAGGAGFFPNTLMRGEYRQSPLALHLTGEALTGPNRVPLEYYLAGEDLFVRAPLDQGWLLMRNVDLAGLYAFQPDRIGQFLLHDVLRAELDGRERLSGSPTLRLRLVLDPAAMGLQADDTGDSPSSVLDTEYTLWVYTRSLKPARLTVTVRNETSGYGYTYTLRWDHRRAWSAGVPDKVRRAARAVVGTGGVAVPVKP